jgi:hypothetical protein
MRCLPNTSATRVLRPSKTSYNQGAMLLNTESTSSRSNNLSMMASFTSAALSSTCAKKEVLSLVNFLSLISDLDASFHQKRLKTFDCIDSNLARYYLEGLTALVLRIIVLVPSLAVKPTRFDKVTLNIGHQCTKSHKK